MKLRFNKFLSFLILGALSFIKLSYGQPFPEGTITPDFTLPLRETGEPFSLYDLEGQVIVLDFFAYWCPPCAFASLDIEENVQKHFATLGGNAQGVPVKVVSVNIESGNPDSTDIFINQVGPELVVDDFDAIAWNNYNITSGIPLFVVINGVANSPSHAQWEVLHNQAGYPGSAFLQDLINQVQVPTDEGSNGESINLFAELEDLGNGWKNSEWFGFVNDTYDPWIYHRDHTWMLIGSGSTLANLYLYDITLGWIFTTNEFYPHVFSFDRNTWLFYEVGSSNPRFFFDTNLQEWFSL